MIKYIHRKSIGDPVACQEAMRSIGDELYNLWNLNKIKGYVNYMDDVESEPNIDKHPFLISVINPEKNCIDDLESIMKRLEFEKLE